MKVAIFYNASLLTEEYLYQPKRLQEEFAAKNIEAELVPTNQYNLYIEAGQIQNEFAQYSFIVFLDKDKYLLTMLTKCGMQVVNSKDAILTCDDKMLTYIALCSNNIAMPKTLAGSLNFYKNDSSIAEQIQNIEKKIQYPLILKESYGSCGQGVYLIKNRENMRFMLDRVLCKPHILQEFIEESAGTDIRVLVIGGKVVGAMQRENSKDFRSNIEQGGIGSIYCVDSTLQKLAEKVAQILQLDYCGIDVLKRKEEYIVCEVNSNAFFKTFERITNINVAKKYVEYLLEKFKTLDKR